jgi:hypothetical protein
MRHIIRVRIFDKIVYLKDIGSVPSIFCSFSKRSGVPQTDYSPPRTEKV